MTSDLRGYRPGRPDTESEAESGGGLQAASPGPEPVLPAENPGSAASAWSARATLEDARRAYVKKNYHRFAEVFARCDAAGGMRPSLAVAPFFFSYLWFFYRKMYLEGFLLMMAGFLVSGAGNGLMITDPAAGLTLSLVGALGLMIFMMVFGKAIYWKAVDRQIEQAMRRYPRDPDKALAWLHSTGGVNIWIVLGLIALAVIFGLLVILAFGAMMDAGGVKDLDGLRRMLEENSLNI